MDKKGASTESSNSVENIYNNTSNLILEAYKNGGIDLDKLVPFGKKEFPLIMPESRTAGSKFHDRVREGRAVGYEPCLRAFR
jgi:hypothetical protein